MASGILNLLCYTYILLNNTGRDVSIKQFTVFKFVADRV
jgi:hypothetical protein